MKTKDNNESYEELTIEKLRTFSGYENISDEEALEELKMLDLFAEMAYECFCNEMKMNTEKPDDHDETTGI